MVACEANEAVGVNNSATVCCRYRSQDDVLDLELTGTAR